MLKPGRELQLGKTGLQILGDGAEVPVQRIGGDMDHPLKVFPVDFYRTCIQFQRSDVLEENRFSVSWRSE